MKNVFFVSGIDTDCGKTMATGILARSIMERGHSVITQKMVQTGCQGIAGDIIEHRKIMGTGLLAEDVSLLTCPYVFGVPASPMLAAQLEGQSIEEGKIERSTAELTGLYDVVIIEGAGGLHVPINEHSNIIDYITTRRYPLVLVASAKLGSINHTLLSIEVCKNRGIEISGLIFNSFFQENPDIIADTRAVVQDFLARYYPGAVFITMPDLSKETRFPVFEGIDKLLK